MLQGGWTPKWKLRVVLRKECFGAADFLCKKNENYWTRGKRAIVSRIGSVHCKQNKICDKRQDPYIHWRA